MHYIDDSISPSAIDANERAVIEKYAFELRSEGDRFVLLDPIIRRANRGKGGRHIGGNLGVLLTAAVTERRAHEANAKAPSDKTDKQRARGRTNPPAAKIDEPVDAAAEPTAEPTAEPALNPVSEPDDGMTADQRAIVARYGFEVTSTGDGMHSVRDPVVAKFYAFKDASKNGKYVGVIAEALATAVQARDEHEARLAAGNGRGKARSTSAKKTAKTTAEESKTPAPAASVRRRAEGKYTQAVRLILAGTTNETELSAKIGSSIHYAKYLVQIVQGVQQVMAETGAAAK